jgi:hypothetical protein
MMKPIAPVLIVALAACTQPAPAPDAATDNTAAVTLSANDSLAVLNRGGAIATTVAQGLAQRLQAQLAETGAAGALDFCSRTALVLTDSLTADQPGVSVKRTSTRIRNPRNEPDRHEQLALAWFDSMRAVSGTLPAAYVQPVSAAEARFYRPLIIAPFCTQCHGPAEKLDPRVRAALQERYPNDRAIGYQEGDLRGVIRVSLPRPQL